MTEKGVLHPAVSSSGGRASRGCPSEFRIALCAFLGGRASRGFPVEITVPLPATTDGAQLDTSMRNTKAFIDRAEKDLSLPRASHTAFLGYTPLMFPQRSYLFPDISFPMGSAQVPGLRFTLGPNFIVIRIQI